MDYHDVLAEVGAGSAHPGGIKSTRRWLDVVNLTPSMSVLEVGCGTGKTAVELIKEFGCNVTGVDIRSSMIKKARRRSQLVGVDANWKVASAEHLPFVDGSFDVVVTESVNVFVRADRALKEYFRVLKPGGFFVDVEMMVTGPVSQAWKDATKLVYGVVHVPDYAGWRRLYLEAGFSPIEVVETRAVRPHEFMDDASQNVDDVDISSPGAFQNPKVLSILNANARWLETHYQSVGFGIFVCHKPKE